MFQRILEDIRPYAWYGIAVCVVLIWVLSSGLRKKFADAHAPAPNLKVKELPHLIRADAKFAMKLDSSQKRCALQKNYFSARNHEVDIRYHTVHISEVLIREAVSIRPINRIGLFMNFEKGKLVRFQYDGDEPFENPSFSDEQCTDIVIFMTAVRKMFAALHANPFAGL